MFKALTPASDWFFVHKQVHDHPPVIHRIAAFAIQEFPGLFGTRRSIVVGMIRGSQGNGMPSHLVPIPGNADGAYLHLDQLTEQEAAIARKTR